jgi:threonine/homoserine/homoserine lactone efflux protein
MVSNSVLAGFWQPLLALLLASTVIMGSPGPSTISATAVGAAFGLRRAFGYVSGLVIGTTVVLLAVALGIVAILLSIPEAARVLTAISALYILYLAFKIATAPPLKSEAKLASAPAFAGGFVLGIANPKAYLAIGAVFAGSPSLAADHALDAGLKIALLGAMIVLIHGFWVLAGASLSRVLRHPLGSRVVNVALAASLVIATGGAIVR